MDDPSRDEVDDSPGGRLNDSLHGRVNDPLHGRMVRSVHAEMSASLHGRVNDPLDGWEDGTPHEQVSESLHGRVNDPLRGRMEDTIPGGVRDSPHDRVNDPLRARRDGAVHGEVGDSLRGRVNGVAEYGSVLDPGRKGLRLLLVLGLLAAVAGGIYAWRSRPSAEPVAPPSPMAGSPLPATKASFPSGGTQPAAPGAFPMPSPTAQVIVHVTGKVKKPGIVLLPIGSRVADAVKAAGGVRSGGTGPLNLARKLIDGEQIVVGGRGQGVHYASSGTGASGEGLVSPPADPTAVQAEPLDLNAATPSQLETLPGVGEVLAARIIEYRQTHAGFRSITQLRDVSGIGDRKFAALRDKVRV
ncbi:ComEA family DNA-binding protein [Sphaerisporangium siamense]|uniref:Competence ComEA-like helix-hairpin-helix protein n=1 Tax=Sphaerisporangium siamense TaxID=795645 RepID=A0A7W7GEC4_9ACTN|nr:ComEA family DNA-binding protein [Sphaerisporangium siamense]MBB4705339.1 competence ComEA-like helix-hairpin-helix protein [Sphaerisporangium siamense]